MNSKKLANLTLAVLAAFFFFAGGIFENTAIIADAAEGNFGLRIDAGRKAENESKQQAMIDSGSINALAKKFEWYAHDFTYSIEGHDLANQSGQIHYRLFAPENVKDGEKYPLVLFMHGASRVGTDNYTHMQDYAMAWAYDAWQAEHPCYVLLPQLPLEGEKTWEVENRYLREYTNIIELIGNEFGNVDMDRLYCTGFSFGAVGSYQTLASRPGFFAAGLIQNGTPVQATFGERIPIENLMDLPIYILHGANDPSINCDEAYRAFTELKAAGKKDMTMEIITVDGLNELNTKIGNAVLDPARSSAHGTWQYAMANVLLNTDLSEYGKTNCMEWLFDQVKGKIMDAEPVLIEWAGADMGNDYRTGTGYTITGWNRDLTSPNIGYKGTNSGEGEVMIARFRIPGPDPTGWDESCDLETTTLKAGDEVYVWLQGYSGRYGDDLAAFETEWDIDWRVLSGSVAGVEVVNAHPQALTDKYVGLPFGNGGGPLTNGLLDLYDGQVFIKVALADSIEQNEKLNIVFHFKTQTGYDYYQSLEREVYAAESGGLGIVSTKNGAVSGIEVYGIGSTPVTSFRGIPFAAPPVGANRWNVPQPVENWEGVRACNEYAPMCAQILTYTNHWGPEFYYDYETNEANMSEDCLYLNVTTASTEATAAADKRPVYVYFHGGSNYHGYSYEPEFAPEELAKKGIVVVSAAYRLGIWGFFVSDELAAEQGGTSGNYGLLDQIAALKWVRDNIAAFGGDPSNVTIGGQSAGARSVIYHLTSDESRGAGLFRRAMIQSARGASTFNDRNLYANNIARAKDYLAGKGFEKLSLAELRALPTEAFFKYGVDRAAGSPNRSGYYNFFAFSIGGHAIPKAPRDVFFTPGAFDGIDILFGSTDGESNAAFNDGLTPLAGFYPTNKERYGDLYDKYDFEAMFPAKDELEARAQDLQRDSESTFMNLKVFAELSYTKKLHKNNMYEYYFAFWTPGRGQEYKWAWHSSDLWYTFKSLRDIPQQRDWTGEDWLMADIMSTYWANFMKTGNPNGPNLPEWPEVNATNKFVRIGAGRNTDIVAKTYLYEGTDFSNRDMLLKEYEITTNNIPF